MQVPRIIFHLILLLQGCILELHLGNIFRVNLLNLMGLLLIPCRLDHFNNFKVSFFFFLLKFIIIISSFIRQAIMNVWIYYLIIYVLLTLIELIILRFIFYFLHLIPPLFHFLPISHLYYLYYLYDLILYNFLLTFNANFQFFYSIIGLMIFVKVKYQLSLAYDKLKIYLRQVNNHKISQMRNVRLNSCFNYL